MSPLRIVAALVACAVASLASAQSYPAKPVRIVVPFPAGGGVDLTARTVGQKLSEYFSQQFVIDNRGGAGGVIGAEITARAVPDGYTRLGASETPAFATLASAFPTITPTFVAIRCAVAHVAIAWVRAGWVIQGLVGSALALTLTRCALGAGTTIWTGRSFGAILWRAIVAPLNTLAAFAPVMRSSKEARDGARYLAFPPGLSAPERLGYAPVLTGAIATLSVRTRLIDPPSEREKYR